MLTESAEEMRAAALEQLERDVLLITTPDGDRIRMDAETAGHLRSPEFRPVLERMKRRRNRETSAPEERRFIAAVGAFALLLWLLSSHV